MDLHIHTCFSDGDLSPEEVCTRWVSSGYKVIAITDHNGIEGSMVGFDYAPAAGIELIPGIEIDSTDELGRDIHILGYGIDYYCPELNDALRKLRIKRARRNDMMLAELNRLGYEITLDDIGSVNEGRYIGKPTFAVILERKGYVASPEEAFREVFRNNETIRSLHKEAFAASDVIALIRKAGGIAVMAHPMEQRHIGESFADFRPRLMAIMDRMMEYGIEGIECYHPSASASQSEMLRKYAEEHGLIITRGSDFHSDRQNRDYSRYHKD